MRKCPEVFLCRFVGVLDRFGNVLDGPVPTWIPTAVHYDGGLVIKRRRGGRVCRRSKVALRKVRALRLWSQRSNYSGGRLTEAGSYLVDVAVSKERVHGPLITVHVHPTFHRMRVY